VVSAETEDDALPAEPLFDLASIDLDQVAVSAEEVGRLNPQRGEMRQLDHVIWLNDAAGEALGVKHVREEEFWVPLHIPGRPLMPGVLMIEAGGQLCSVHLQVRMKSDRFIVFIRCDETIFRGQVVPGDTLYLLAKEVSFRRRRLVSRTQGMVNGRIVFESKITGLLT
jgi:3-hydroxyacyl-[acyl-carrier-protein] dehydratase